MTVAPLSWSELEAINDFSVDLIHGATNSQSGLRLFGQTEDQVRVTLYRDHHAWCPYCQKVWLWLEEKQIPYRIQKVSMVCYGQKQDWYKQKVPSGMLPALELDGRLITESDDILIALERTFGPLGYEMTDATVIPLRQLERSLFRAWCIWLCSRYRSEREEQRRRDQFTAVIKDLEAALDLTPPYFLPVFSVVDVIFTPFLERMNASLYYYKGYSLREENIGLAAWFAAMETRSTYRGTQSDFHTHVHDLPPQMGGCYSNAHPQTQINQNRVNFGPWLGLPDVSYPEPDTARQEALYRVLKHRTNIMRVNPASPEVIDWALRCALTKLIKGEDCLPPPGSDGALRYLRDRISVPRDMSIYAAKHLRQALEVTAALAGDGQPAPLPVNHRQDQNPANFNVSSA
ncbi:glutathione S-transferase family protein [Candidatus Synechococcus calcipolaris G9]|uniref:Glutathione S-transferase family protein n=1 Tax=Candidatus Synechococcus calcipolaris G9 TaxID=1497997 RepID=A0ABT6F0M0_9SYNE|nr:glutathione S-transferase family protein [Candidatus Synechococcus calcipolaris]MDG2991404.1 glutathione S-transferase family protein [Candidatus Synechococcus calcipolaris G9]